MAVDRAVLLAAGRGRRLAPFTDAVPKPMLRLAGRPLLEHILRQLRACGIRRVLLVIGYLGHEIRAYFGDGRTEGLQLSYIDQPLDPGGTGAAALMAEAYAGDGPFFLGWGDILAAGPDYAALFAAYARQPGPTLLALEPVAEAGSGAAVTVAGDRILRLEEKPPPGTPAVWNQAGLGVFTKTLFPVLRSLPLSPRGEIEFTAGVQALINAGLPVAWLGLCHPRLHLTNPDDIPRVERVLRRSPLYITDLA